MRLNASICAALFGVTLAIYWPARHFEMIYLDDEWFLNLDPSIGLNRHGMAWAMTSVMVANWHPLTLFSFLLTHRFWGINPGVEHMVNAVLHAANAVLLFLVLVRMTGLRSALAPQAGARMKSETAGTPVPLGENIWPSAAVAAIFAWHPLRVESVAWIAERKDVLFTFFMFLALLCYASYAQPQDNGAKPEAKSPAKLGFPRRTGWYVMALVFFIVSFMSKAMVVTLPFLLLLLDFWPLQRFRNATLRKLVFEKIPFFALALVFCAVTYHMQKTTGAVATLQEISIPERLENATLSYVNYLGKFFWPDHLAIIYPFPKGFDEVKVTLNALLLLAISALCVLQISRRPYLAMGWFWYLGTMVPVIGLVDVGGLAMADRYTYVTMIGPVISLVWLLSEWGEEIRFRKFLTAAVAVALLMICVVLTRRQLMYWQNNLTLFKHTAEVSPVNGMTQLALAAGLAEKGRLRESAVHYQIAARLVPGDYLPDYYLAIYLRNNGFERQALTEDEAVASDGCDPNNDFADMNLADALTQLGRYGEAVGYLEAALRVNPDSTEAMNNLSWTLATCRDASVRDGGRAVQLGERTCELTNYKQAIFVGTLAAAYAEDGRFDEAAATAQRAIALAQQHGETTLVQKNKELLRVYLAHKPYHEAKLVPASN
jgi:hypothetical protein